ncbi:ABC transporter permease subunit, partial [Methanoculleus sp. 7T]|uniref:ABC transporter permease subunit n=1 Tax=Methanoculleus sp. 7T TaxID=2937282 RepID=UPI0020C08AA1
VVPNLDETIRVLIFGALSFLLIVAFFALSLFFSTVMETSGSALVSTLIVFITLSSVAYLISSGAGITILIGESPKMPGETYQYTFQTGPESMSSVVGSSDDGIGRDEYEQKWEEYEAASKAYQGKRQAITDVFALLSPDRNYQKLSFAVAEPGMALASRLDPGQEIPESGLSALSGLLGSLAGNVVALLVFPAAFFGLAWVRFVREDVR